ncbi:MAG TPA: shikimate kinase [Flavisolibacter sp.]|jgi:shikimate kinase
MKIFLIGFMGCGKTHWGRQLGQKLQIPFFDLDEKIVEQEGRSVSQIFEEDGEEYFRMLEKEILYMLTDGHETFVMATGGGTPCFYNNIDYLKQRGTVVWLNCPVECLYQRLVKEKEQRPLLRKISDSELKSYIIRKFSNRKIFYQQAGVIIQEDILTLDKLVSLIFHS